MELWFTEQQGSNIRYGLRVSETLFSKQSEFQQVDVVTTKAYGRMLLLDGLVMTTERDEFVYHEMISHVPLLSMPRPPRRVLVIGGGDGGTVREVLKHPSVEEVVLCEIDPVVIEASKAYLPTIAAELDNPRCTIEVRDGVDYIQQQPDESFDVILIDSTDPIGPGVGLFNVAFYEQVKRVLAPDGIVTAQTESPFFEEEGLNKIYSNLREVFPVTTGYYGIIPTYPGNLWTWCFCSKSVQPGQPADKERQAVITATTHYYNEAIHQGAFALPSFLRRSIRPQGLASTSEAASPC